MKLSKKQKQGLGLWLGVLLFTFLFPYVVTRVFVKVGQEKVYVPMDSGRQVILEGGSSLDLERFLPCALYGVMPYNYPKEALKAQMVILRTYIMREMQDRTRIDVKELNIPYTTYEELEGEWGKDYEKRYNEAMRLVQETNLQVILYQGDMIYPYYHEISEGTTCTGEFEYLQPAVSSEDSTADNYLSIFYFTPEELENICKEEWGLEIAGAEFLSKLVIEKYENCNYVKQVKLGEQEISPEAFMQGFSLASTSFVAEEFAGGIKMVCKGKGSGKGVSIYGACCMADEGSDYQDILCHYYTGVTVEKMK